MLDPNDFDHLYVDFFGEAQEMSLARVLVHELGHAALGLGDPLPYNAGTPAYLALLADPESDHIGDTVRFENDVMASSPFGETGRAHYANTIRPSETIPERLLGSYTYETAVDFVVHSSVTATGSVLINRIGAVIDDD